MAVQDGLWVFSWEVEADLQDPLEFVALDYCTEYDQDPETDDWILTSFTPLMEELRFDLMSGNFPEECRDLCPDRAAGVFYFDSIDHRFRGAGDFLLQYGSEVKRSIVLFLGPRYEGEDDDLWDVFLTSKSYKDQGIIVWVVGLGLADLLSDDLDRSKEYIKKIATLGDHDFYDATSVVSMDVFVRGTLSDIRSRNCNCGNGDIDFIGVWDGVETWEECDPPSDVCTLWCSEPECGNHIRECLEECDDALDTIEPNMCRPDCTVPFCGDGVVDNEPPYWEACDDGLDPNEFCEACQLVCEPEELRPVEGVLAIKADQNVEFSWSPVSGATGYTVLSVSARVHIPDAHSGNPHATEACVPGEGQSWCTDTDAVLPSGSARFYQVRASCEGREAPE
ncbi:MAG: hypothetical protein ABH833_04310 [Parcubacteria group bacterium]